MLSKKGALRDFITENLTFIIILMIVLALLFMLFFSGALLGTEGILSGFGKNLIDMIGA